MPILIEVPSLKIYPMEKNKSFFEGILPMRDALWGARSLEYDREILKHADFEIKRVDMTLCMQSPGS